jgi:hypothetical protein
MNIAQWISEAIGAKRAASDLYNLHQFASQHPRPLKLTRMLISLLVSTLCWHKAISGEVFVRLWYQGQKIMGEW